MLLHKIIIKLFFLHCGLMLFFNKIYYLLLIRFIQLLNRKQIRLLNYENNFKVEATLNKFFHPSEQSKTWSIKTKKSKQTLILHCKSDLNLICLFLNIVFFAQQEFTEKNSCIVFTREYKHKQFNKLYKVGKYLLFFLWM